MMKTLTCNWAFVCKQYSFAEQMLLKCLHVPDTGAIVVIMQNCALHEFPLQMMKMLNLCCFYRNESYKQSCLLHINSHTYWKHIYRGNVKTVLSFCNEKVKSSQLLAVRLQSNVNEVTHKQSYQSIHFCTVLLLVSILKNTRDMIVDVIFCYSCVLEEY